MLQLFAGCGADSAMKKGDKFFALGEYYDAAAQYKKAYSQTKSKDRPLRGQRALKMADCYRRINYTQRAIAAYNNATRYKQSDSLSNLYLAQLLLKNGSYKEAERLFQQLCDSAGINVPNTPYLASLPQLADPYHRQLAVGLQSARLAPKWKADAALSGYTVKKQDAFNSRRAEYSPMLTGNDYDQLYFTSTRNQAQGEEYSGITGTKAADVFVSTKDDKGKWSKPEPAETDLNTDFDEGACSFSPDGKTMYLTLCQTDPSYPRYAQIATSKRSDASWSKSTPLEVSRDTLSAFAHPAVSPDGQWLYYVSNMPGGMGGYDIWRSPITTNGLGAPENLGEPINTPGNEMFPTFRPNGDLYFSSTGHPGMGGLDIYIAKPVVVEATTTTKPRTADEQPNDSTKQTTKTKATPAPQDANAYILDHPGAPLNSAADDFGMTFEGLHNRGFFSSNRGDARGWDHIYSFEKDEITLTVRGWVYEKDGYELPQALVYMVGNDGTNLKLSVKGDGSFTQEVRPGVDYVFLGTCKGFLNHKEQLHPDTVKQSFEHVLQFPLASITAPVLIDNIFYDFDKATLRPESTQSLDELILLLNENPNVTIELSAHCDYRGPAAYNKALSQRRAESVVNYLVEHGIAADRLSPMGYGKEKPKTIKRKLTETYTWLKEGDVLTEEFIKALDDEEKQEICNQLNRRTEFIVLRTTYGMTFDEQTGTNGDEKTTNQQKKEEQPSPEEDFIP